MCSNRYVAGSREVAVDAQEPQQSVQQSVQPVEPLHPVLVCADVVEAALKDVAGVDPGFMRTPEKAEALRRLSRVSHQVQALLMRVMATADDVAETTADHSVATWLAAETRTDVRDRYGELGLARGLERRWTRLAAGVSDGSVNLAQARVIAHALENLPAAEVGPEALVKAEETLIDYAASYGPRELRRLGRRILEVAAPELCEQQEGKALEREEQRAAAVTSLSLRHLGDGTTRITGRVADAVADRLRTYLEAYTSPRHRTAADDEPGEPASPRKRLGQAFGAFLEAADPQRMPVHGGDATAVLVTIDLTTLLSDLAGVGLVGEEPISAGQVRRLACTAQIIPVVLGADSEVLDLGRSSRLFSPAQRKALAVRDKRCRAEGCTIPAAWCEAHHANQPWAQGGRTDLADGVLLCAWHHHRAHTTDTTPNDYPTATTDSTDEPEIEGIWPRLPVDDLVRLSAGGGMIEPAQESEEPWKSCCPHRWRRSRCRRRRCWSTTSTPRRYAAVASTSRPDAC
jgi:hypothetical protein